MKQWTYIRYERTESLRYFNCPCLIVYADTIAEADKQFKEATGVSPAKLAHVGVRCVEVTHAKIKNS